MPIFSACFFAALLAGDVSMDSRLAMLAPLFEPKPGGELRLDPTELRDNRGKIPAGRFRTYIEVSPPKGHCLTITTKLDEPDLRVCKKTRIAVKLSEIDRFGRIEWYVKTGEGDFGTPLSWTMPYRLALTIPFNNTENDPPVYEFIESCTADKHPTGRRILLKLVNGKTWVLRFPNEDQLLPQPAPVPFLQTPPPSTKRGIEADTPSASPAETKPSAAHGEKDGDEPKKPPDLAASNKTIDDDLDRQTWALPRRDSYQMESSYFQPAGSVAPGTQGLCRYRYSGPPEDPKTGRVQCFDTDLYKMVLIPLTCLQELR